MLRYDDTKHSLVSEDGIPTPREAPLLTYGVEAFAETFLAVIRKDKEFAACYPRQYGYIKDVVRKVKKGQIK